MSCVGLVLIFQTLHKAPAVGIGRTHAIRQSLAKQPAAVVLDNAHLIVADSIYPKLGQKEARIVDQELRYPIIPVGEDLAAGPSLIGEKQAVVLVVRRLPVIK